MNARLDSLLPSYTFRHAHVVWIRHGDPAQVLAHVRNAPLGNSVWIRTLFKLRGLPSPAHGSAVFIKAMGWTELVNEPSEFAVGYTQTDTGRGLRNGLDFTQSPATRKVAFAFYATLVSTEIVELRTETRVLCSSHLETLRFWCYWMLVRPFSALIRLEILRLVKQVAESEWLGADQARGDTPPQVVAKPPRGLAKILRAFFRVTSRVVPRLAVEALGTLMTRIPRRRRRADEARFLKTGQPLQLPFGSEALNAYAFGSGPTVLLVHGLLGSAADFRRLIPEIAGCGYRALAIEWTNHGASPSGPVLAANSIPNLAGLMAGLEDLHAVVGHSAGAYFAMLAVALLPAHKKPPQIVLISAPTTIEVPILATMNELGLPLSLHCDVCRWFARKLDIRLDQLEAPLVPSATAWSRLLFIHDPLDPYAPYRVVAALAAQDERVSLLTRPGAGHFKLLQDASAIDAVSHFVGKANCGTSAPSAGRDDPLRQAPAAPASM